MGVVSGQCQSCGSPLAADQRYCLVCGERRGTARFSLSALAPAAPPPPPVAARPHGPRINAGAAFVAFVAVLLLAMGVGVLIGHTNNSQAVQRADSPHVNVTVAGGGSGAGTGAGTAASTKSKKHAKTQTAAVKPLPKKVIVKAAAAAANVLGGKNLPPPTVTVGQKGSGPGFQNGHFTGNFFGGN